MIVLRSLLFLVLLAGISCGLASVRADDDLETLAGLLELVVEVDEDSARKCLGTIAAKIQTGEVGAQQSQALRERLRPLLTKLSSDSKHPLRFEASLLAAGWGEEAALAIMKKTFLDASLPPERRLAALDALWTGRDPFTVDTAAKALLDREKNSPAFRGAVLSALGKVDEPRVAAVVLGGYANYEPELQPKAIELVTQRPAWIRSLLFAIESKKIPVAAVNANQLARLQNSSDESIRKQTAKLLGTVRTDRNPQREQVVADMKAAFAKAKGDPVKGRETFNKVCGQCHKIYGQGHDVGPEITSNGRSNYEQLLSNVFDPSLVIGPAYQARNVSTNEGRVLTGLLAEENAERVVLKMQGGKIETIPREKIEEINVSPLSLMPEGLEKQLTPAELADLFAFITLDRPPEENDAKRIVGAPSFTGE